MSPIGLARLCENMRARETRRIVFSIVFSRLLSSAFLASAFSEISRTVMTLKPSIKKRSTNRDVPPPISIIDAS